MSTSNSQDDFAAAGQPSPAFVRQLRALQVVTAAIGIGSMVVVGLIMLVTRDNGAGQPELIAYVGIALAVANLSAHSILPNAITAQQLQKISREDLMALSVEERQLKIGNVIRGPHIVGSALLEGAVVINAIAYLIENWLGNLAIAAVLIVMILMRIPSRFGMYNKVTDKLQEIESS